MIRRARPSARILLLDAAGRVLLFRFRLADGRDFWATPGGGLEPGEDFADAARRELFEETGLDADIAGDPVLDLSFDMVMPDGEPVAAREVYFVHRVTAHDLVRDGWTDLETAILAEHRWWTPADLAATGETVYPLALAEVLTRL